MMKYSSNNLIASFRLVDFFFLKSLDSLMLSGEIIDGEISIGDKIFVNDLFFEIDGIESSYGKKNGEQISLIVLRIRGDDLIEQLENRKSDLIEIHSSGNKS